MTTQSTHVAPRQAHRRAPHLVVQVLGLLALTGFAIVTTVMAFVMFWLAGVVLTLAFVWFGFRALPGDRRKQATVMAPVRNGNVSFDTYRDGVLRRLEDEQASFDSFLIRLRKARDSAEFDAFMEGRAQGSRPAIVMEDAPQRGEY